MMKHWLLPIVLAAGTVAGCGMNVSPTDLVKAPALDTNKQEVNQAVMQYLPAGAKLTIPSRPQNASAVSLKDLDGDGQDEVMVFYKKEKTDFQVGVLVLKKEKEMWQLVSNIEGLGRDLDFVSYQDITGDKLPELEIGWSGGEGLKNELAVYSMKENKINELWKQSYSQMDIGDLTGDSTAELAIIQHDRDQMKASAQVFAYQDHQMKKISELPLDGSVNGYEQVLIGNATPTEKGIFIDSGTGAHSGVTDLLVMRNGQLKNVLLGPDGSWLAFKPYPSNSTDINHDGIVEIGLLIEPVDTDALSMADTPWITVWSQWDGQKGFRTVQENYTDYNLGIDFKIPSAWRDKHTLKKEHEGDTNGLSFFYIGQSKKSDAKLLTLRFYPKKDWIEKEKSLNEKKISHFVAGENNELVIVAIPPSGKADLNDRFMQEYKQLLLTEEQIRASIQMVHL